MFRCGGLLLRYRVPLHSSRSGPIIAPPPLPRPLSCALTCASPASHTLTYVWHTPSLFALSPTRPEGGAAGAGGGGGAEEQGTWASCTQKHSEAGYGRPVDGGAWAAKTVKRPRQQPAHPQYANYWALLTRKRHTMHTTRAGAAPRTPGGARHRGDNRAVNSQPGTGQSMLYGDVKPSYGGAGGWDRRGCAKGAPSGATRQGEEQHRHTERRSHTRRDKGEHSRQGGGAQQGRRGNQNSGNREPEWSGWGSVRMGSSDNKGDGLASQRCRYRVPGRPLLNRHQVGGVSRSPDGLFAQQEREPIRGRPAVKGKRTYGGRPGQRVEEQGTWASQKHSEAGYGRPVDRGVWTSKTVKRPRQQPAHPQYANYWAADAQTAHHATSSTAPTHQPVGSANAETTPAGAPAAAADRTQRPDATCEGKNR